MHFERFQKYIKIKLKVNASLQQQMFSTLEMCTVHCTIKMFQIPAPPTEHTFFWGGGKKIVILGGYR